MRLPRWDPFQDLRTLENKMNRRFRQQLANRKEEALTGAYEPNGLRRGARSCI